MTRLDAKAIRHREDKRKKRAREAIEPRHADGAASPLPGDPGFPTFLNRVNRHGQITGAERWERLQQHRAIVAANGHGETDGRVNMVDLAALLDRLSGFVRRFVVLSDEQLVAVVLWVVHTWAIGAAETTPYLAIDSAEKESGKTRLLEVLEPLVARPWLTGRVTAAVLARKTDKESPTLLLDESDAAFNGDKEYGEVLRGILNTGYRHKGVVSICVGQGASIDYRDLKTFGAKAIAGISGSLPDTVASRSIPIRLKRRLATEPIERMRIRDLERDAEPLRIDTESIATHLVPGLADARPEIPKQLSDRAADVWEPLLAIADLAGDGWADRGRRAAVALSAAPRVSEESVGVMLLRDIDSIFEQRTDWTADADRISSADLAASLRTVEESPWADWQHGKGLTPNSLARLLSRYEIRPRSTRLADGSTPKGYHRDQFEDALNRLTPVFNRHTATTSIVEPKTGDFQPPQPSLCGGSESDANPHEHSDVAVWRFKPGDESPEGLPVA